MQKVYRMVDNCNKMKRIQAFLCSTLLVFQGNLAMATGESRPGVIGDGGMMNCGGMMMGSIMIVPILGATLLLVTLVLAILALIKYLRHD